MEAVTMPTHHSPEAVLEQLDWVTRLARQLCADATIAEDASQEVLLAAWRKPPPEGASLRKWLAGVLRKRLKHAQRSEWRRRVHEGHAARDANNRVPSSDELVERALLSRKVVDAVVGMREPYRGALLQRYVEDLTPQAIAARSGESVATVKARLRRGLAELRSQLDRQHGGDGHSWMLALLPLMPKVAVPGAATTGVLAVGSKSIALPVCAALIIALGVFLTVRAAIPSSSAEPLVAVSSEVLIEPKQKPPEDPELPSGNTERLVRETATVAEAVAPALAPEVSAQSVAARVLDLGGRPLAAVEVRFRGEQSSAGDAGSPVAVTDDRGEAHWTTEEATGFVFVKGAGLVTCIEGVLTQFEGGDFTVIVAGPARDLSGQVVTSSGIPLSEAKVAYVSADSLRTRFAVSLDHDRVRRKTASDSGGVFSFSGVPELPGSLTVELVGYEDAHLPVPEQGDPDLRVVLEPVKDRAVTVVGRVLDAAGDPVHDAFISLGHVSVRSTAGGRFQLDGSDNADALQVRALHSKHGAGSFEREPGEPWPDSVEIYLDQPPLSITGKVVDGQDRPFEGVRVTLHNPTEFGWIPLGEDGGSFIGTSVERVLAQKARGEAWLTDADGRFRVGGLLDRDYRLLAVDGDSLRACLSPLLPAGSEGVELVLPDPRTAAVVAGRVVDAHGVPLPEVSVRLQRNLSAADAQSESGVSLRGPHRTTDADGRFEFSKLETEGLVVAVFAGEEFPLWRRPLGDFAKPDQLEIKLVRQAEFFVELISNPDRAENFALLNTQGERIPLSQTLGMSMFSVEAGSIADGRSPVYRAREGRATLVLLREDSEIERVEVNLRAGDVNSLSL